MHLESARRLLDELAMETEAEEARIEEEEERKKKEMKRPILPHLFMRQSRRVLPMVRTPPQSPQPEPQPQRQQAFTIPPTEDWDSEATQTSSALPITRVNWENNWSRRCVCGARPGRCPH